MISSPRVATRRVMMTLSYDGTGYVGWQRQLNGRSIQAALENAISNITNETITVTGASRTDAGVHAAGQTVHFDTASRIPDEKFPLAVNTKLPPAIRVLTASTALDGFHARFHAKGKQYRYCIHNSRVAPALERLYRWHVPYPLDVGAMRAEAEAMVGEHNFAAFAASGSIVKDTVRTVYSVSVDRGACDADLIEVWISGSGFLYNMVRILSGTLVDVGCGRREPGAIASALVSGDRLVLGQTAPPHGLTLMRVEY